MKTSLTRNIAIGFGFSIFLLLASAIASFISIQNLLISTKWVNHTHEVIEQLEAVVSPVKDAESSQRGFLLTNDPDFLEPYNGSLQNSLNALQKVKDLTIDNTEQQKNTEQLKGIIRKRFNSMRTVIDEKKINNVINTADVKKGQVYMDSIISLTQRMKDIESSLLVSRVSTMNTFIGFTPVIILGASLLAIIISFFYFIKVRKDILEKAALQISLQQKDEETTNRINIIQNLSNKISAGNYNIRLDDQQKDGLGILSGSLNKMAESLDKSFLLLSTKEWLQTGVAKLNESMVGEKTINTLAHSIIAFIASYTKSQVGAFYLLENEKLSLTGSFALIENNKNKEIKIGDGIVGECALSGKKIIIKNIPAENIFISFTSAGIKPASVLAFPFYFENTLKGVIELGSLYEFSDLHEEFLNSVSANIGIAVNTSQSRTKLQDLLEETQAQSEELQAQHNEMENMNAEMETQTEKLQLSEEELKVQQEELMATNRELEERSKLLEEKNYLISERNIEIQKKAEELAQSTKYKSEFLANMSHELRTPLNSILLLSRLLTENNQKNLSDEQVEYAKVIRSSGNGLLELIDEILDLSKIEAGKMDLEYSIVPLAVLVSGMHSLFSQVALQKNVQLNISIDNNVPAEIETDKLRLEQVLKNLISNALKFTEKGFVECKIALSSNIIPTVDFIVRDSGIGIAEEKQQLIFEAFQQADGSTRRKFGGTGLGLSISRELVKLLSGEITLKSKTGEGSTFTVSIPLSPLLITSPENKIVVAEKKPVEEKQEKIVDQKKSHLTVSYIPGNIPDDRSDINKDDKIILIIEDDTMFAKALLEFARKKQYKGIVAVRGDEGIELAEKFNPVGILLDIQLPVKNGWEVMEELKQNIKTKHIPVHIMSSFEVKHESLMKGAVDFINKPFAYEQMGDIFEKIEFVLNRESKKVLIVEENSKHAKALAYFLSTFEVKSEISETVAESINALQNQDTDCVILDMGIPDIKAYEMLEKIKQTEGLANIPIIIFTGKNISGSEERKILQYADSIVIKTAHSYKRILDEVSLFLHLVNENKTSAEPRMFDKMRSLNEVLKNKNVLIADDDVRNIYSISKALENHRMNVLPAMDGKEAIEILEQNPQVDIILMDMMMPEMDGYDTIKNIKNNPKHSNIPIIAVTAKAMTGDREKCIRAGASDYISKPVDVDQLTSLLRVWLYEK